jgi:hypothetical protein
MSFERGERIISVPEEVEKLRLPRNSFIVMGSGILSALGIRPVNDIDLVVRTSVFAELRQSGWTDAIASSGQKRIEKDMFEVYDSWTEVGSIKTVDQLLEEATVIDGIPYNPLDKVYAAKYLRGRDKDLVDLQLIEDYRIWST